jgi:hypothetical protein
MYSDVEEHVIYQIANAPLLEYPYPHIYVDPIFPDDFYAAMRRNWPASSSLVSLASTGRVPAGSYPERFILPFTPPQIGKLPAEQREFWIDFASWFLEARLLNVLVEKFDRYVQQRFKRETYKYHFRVDSLIVRDITNYNIGPHTDAPHRLLSLLFYCPDDLTKKHLGTSIYVPIDPDFSCQGGPHYSHKLFKKVKTMEYRPNALFAFFKTDNSFHGVEPIGDADVLRDLLLYDIRAERTEQQLPGKIETRAPSLGIRMLKNIFGAKK